MPIGSAPTSPMALLYRQQEVKSIEQSYHTRSQNGRSNMPEAHYIIISAALIVSLVLSQAYAQILKPIQHIYIPNGLIITVAIGDFLIWLTQATLEYVFAIAPTSLLTGAIMVAWGIPIARWQLEEFIERRERNRAQLLEGSPHGKATRSPRGP